MTEGQEKDLILQSIIREKNPLRNGTEIWEELFPEKTLDEVLYLLKKIDESNLETPKLKFNPYDILVINKGLSEITLKNGGFTKLESELKLESNFIKEKEKLEFDNLKLQNENLEYQKSIRNMENKIKKLTTDNLRLENWDIRFRWYIAIIGFLIGIITKYFMDK